MAEKPPAWTAATTMASCCICHGSGLSLGGPCRSCAAPDPVKARKVLGLLSPHHMRFLRQFEHTLAYQPVTAEEYEAVGDSLVVIDRDAEYGDDYLLLCPATEHWLGHGWMHHAPGQSGWLYFIGYHPLGLLLRECVMAGATAYVRP